MVNRKVSEADQLHLEDTSDEVSSVFSELDQTLDQFQVFLQGCVLLDPFFWRVLSGKAADPMFEVPLELSTLKLTRQTRALLSDFVKVSFTNEMTVKKLKPLENENLSLAERVTELELKLMN